MFDGITPGEVPAGAQLYAAYLDGHWPDFAALVAEHPGCVGVSIAVSAGYNGGKVLDVEKGDATPTESVDWVLMRRAAGVDPTVYCSMSAWPAVIAAFKARGVVAPHYWIADYSLGTNPALPAGAIALQYADKGGYDVSIVADYWPGVDPEPEGIDTMTPAQETQLLEQVNSIFAAIFEGGTSTGHTPPGAATNSLVNKLDYVAAQLAADGPELLTMSGEVHQLESAPLTVDAAALAAALAGNAAFVEAIASAVVAQIGAAAPTAQENAAATVGLIETDLGTAAK
jgi:hypothetical protein